MPAHDDDRDILQELKRYRARYPDGKTALRSRHNHKTELKGKRRTTDVTDNDYPGLDCGHFWGTGNQLGGICPVCRQTGSGVVCDKCFISCNKCQSPICKQHSFPSIGNENIRLCASCSNEEHFQRTKDVLWSLAKWIFLKKEERKP